MSVQFDLSSIKLTTVRKHHIGRIPEKLSVKTSMLYNSLNGKIKGYAEYEKDFGTIE
ncbi:MAG: hypothetical protein KIS76_16640 [Pyrinomonadaceae bacterium]|nr:hypothetical protein [Pyrinomonadaceae bacterium]